MTRLYIDFSHLTRPTVIALAVAALLGGCASSTKDSVSGAHRSQLLLVSADTVNQASLKYYAEQNAEARTKGELITSGAEFARVSRIMQNMIPQVGVFRADATQWN